MRDDEASVKRPTVQFGGMDVVVTDPAGVQPVVCEIITDVRLLGDNISISFAAYNYDGSGPPEARVVSRLRVPRLVMADIQRAIEQVLAREEKAKQSAN